MPGRYETMLGDALEKARAQFDHQFMFSRDCQRREYWLRLLGELIAQVRDEVSRFTGTEISADGVETVIAKVGVMAALSDFCLERFGEEIARGRG